MATPTQKWVLGLVIMATVALLAVIAGVARQPAPPPTVETPKPACRSTADCPPGNACVAPGRCSQTCTSERDCPPGRTCAELRAMQAGADGVPTTVMTCVIATPN
jgi:hypothetical protein